MNDHVAVYAVLLAAGASKRFGAADKLLADLGGNALVTAPATCLLAAAIDGLIAVVGPGSNGKAVSAALYDLPIRIVVNPDAALGIGASIACGAAAVPDGAGIMIVPADMPLLDDRLIGELLVAFRRTCGHRIVHPVTRSGKQRNPVIWPDRMRAELMALDPLTGGKPLLVTYRDEIVTVTAENDQAFSDIDTQDDLVRARSHRP